MSEIKEDQTQKKTIPLSKYKENVYAFVKYMELILADILETYKNVLQPLCEKWKDRLEKIQVAVFDIGKQAAIFSKSAENKNVIEQLEILDSKLVTHEVTLKRELKEIIELTDEFSVEVPKTGTLIPNMEKPVFFTSTVNLPVWLLIGAKLMNIGAMLEKTLCYMITVFSVRV